ncbi:hypothetical protein LCGC14_0764900 [marine sediment metagenome]|uniref:Uncharacterized protein n=1 Tax=marine sediment metagenome TaxID=412755 RepID=A0A0F9SK72_9ZZZZ
MASGDTLNIFTALHNIPPDWEWVAFTSGSTEPTADGDGTAVIWGDSSNATGVLEFLSLESGTWGGTDAAGYMLLSNRNATAWTADENFTADSGTPANHGTLTGSAAGCAATIDLRNSKPVLDFDATVNELAVFSSVLPRNYAGGGVTATIGWMASSATTNDTSWKLRWKSVTDDLDDLDVKVYAAPQANAAVDVASASGEVDYFTIAFTAGAQMDSTAAGELFYIMLERDAQDGTADDMAGDAEFVFMELQET